MRMWWRSAIAACSASPTAISTASSAPTPSSMTASKASPDSASAERHPNKGTKMIDLYTWPTPNGRKISIMLEEIALPYRAVAIDISNGAQLEPEFLRINPNGKIPAITDSDGPGGTPITIFESGAILIYLAEKT